MLKIRRQMEAAAQTDVSVLVSGERGVGKAACARQIHFSGSRSAEPFISIDAEEINKHGLPYFVAQVGYGTLYIDEIATLVHAQQLALLELLTPKQSTDAAVRTSAEYAFRLIVSSTQPLEGFVKQGSFLRELYYLLCTTKIRLLALRERREDFPVLIKEFIRKYSEDTGLVKTIDPAVIELLAARSWPGNIYELQSSIQYAFQRAQSEIQEADLPAWSTATYYTSDSGESLHDELYRISGELVQTAGQLERFDAFADYKKLVMPPLINAAMAFTDGNISAAAKLLGITRNTLKKIIREYEIEKEL
jgi:DNA-binding NtrC family response regulator